MLQYSLYTRLIFNSFRMDDSPQPPPLVHTNGFHGDKASPEPVHIVDSSVIKVQNGELSRHGKGTETELEESPVL